MKSQALILLARVLRKATTAAYTVANHASIKVEETKTKAVAAAYIEQDKLVTAAAHRLGNAIDALNHAEDMVEDAEDNFAAAMHTAERDAHRAENIINAI